jgi:hypothetical protein
MFDELKKKFLTLGIVEDNEYLDKYINIITNNSDTLRLKYKTQKHHIIPRAVFQHNKEPVDNNTNNIVNLTYQDHILAHYYLFMCATGWFKYPAAKAVDYLIKRIESIRVKPNAFNQIEISFSEEDLLKLLPELTYIQEQAKLGEHKRLAGGKWVNNGQIQKYVGGPDLEEFLLTNDSWKIGKLPVSEETREKQRQKKPVNTGTRVINNGQRNKYVPVSKVDDYLKNGWILGRFDVSYNKGKTLSAEAKQKISNTKKSKHLTPWNKGTKGLQTANKTTFKPGMTPHNTGRKYVNNGKEELWVNIDQIAHYVESGFKLGRLPGAYKKHSK